MDPVEYEMLRHMWFPVARVADMENGVASGSILGEEPVVYGDEGRVTVAQGFCPHIGVALRLGPARRSAGIPLPRLAVRNGQRAVRAHSLAPTGPEPAARGAAHLSRRGRLRPGVLGDAFLPPPRLPEYVDDRWRLGAGEPNTLKCGMRLLTENFRDKAHFPFVHADSMGHVDKVVEPCPITRDGWRLGWSCSLGSEGVPKELAEEFSHRLDYHITLPVFASICVSSPSGGRRLVAQVATPVSVDGRTVRQFWLAGTDAESTAQGADLADVLGFERQVFEEDHPVGVGGGDEFGAGSVYQGAGRFWEGVAVFLGLLGPVRLPGRPHETVGHWPGSAFAA
ncbi:Rieske 2Fe-2S domain-containing protein [Streptomyces sp. NPDC056669]|uniref:Rieske 2Fe-2S domain-containing protein n=1 Tax=Streptomyces sp. NPDC056669 TaxID=3345903 RepID=UPI00367E097D